MITRGWKYARGVACNAIGGYYSCERVQGELGSKHLANVDHLELPMDVRNFAPESSNSTGFERSHGFMPWDEFNNMVSAINNFGRAVIVNWSGFFTNVQQNAPQTERELLRWHASFLNSCLDVVNGRIQAVEQFTVRPPVADSPVDGNQAPERINIE